MVFFVIALSVFGLDRLLKGYVEKNKESGCEEAVCGGKLVVTKSYNRGAFLNTLEKYPSVVLALSAMLFGGLLLLFGLLLREKGNGLMKTGMALVIGGAASNLYDRITKGAVTDYLSLRLEKLERLKRVIFNLGDLAIFLGGFFVILATLFKTRWCCKSNVNKLR